MSKRNEAAIATCRTIFGESPEDVIAPIKSAADTLWWLNEIFVTIKNEAGDPRNSMRVRNLAEAGAYLALDVANYAGCQHEGMIRCLHDAGIAPDAALKR